MAIKTRGLLEKFIPVLLVLSVGLSFLVGVLWQKVSTLEKGAKVAGTNTQGTQPTDISGKLTADQAKNLPALNDADHVRGDKNAKVVLIEYSDFECPFCKQFHPTLNQALNDYKGQIALVYRHFPLSFHQNAQKEAEASECINELGGNDAFWKFADIIFDRTTSNGTGFALTKLGPLASELGLNKANFQDCLDSGKYKDYVVKQENDGATAGVTGTPGTFVVNKKGEVWLVSGAVGIDQLKTTIDEALKS